MKRGDLVIPKTPAGLELSNEPHTNVDNSSGVACVFKGTGRVLRSEQHFLDYEEYDRKHAADEEHVPCNIGKMKYTSLLIECDAGQGWAGEGAVMNTEEKS
jgi:hypothetical protein